MREKGNSRKDFEQLNRKIDKLVATNSQLVSQISNFSKKIEDLETANKCQSKEFTEAINGLKTTINELKATIKEKDSEIADLREKLNKDSTNSSKPPSTDFYNKPNPKPSTLNSRDRKGTNKKTNGGQKGHPGKTMELKEEPDAVQRCTPKACDGCPLFGECKTTVVGSRSVVDVVIQTFQTQFDQVQSNCPKQGGHKGRISCWCQFTLPVWSYTRLFSSNPELLRHDELVQDCRDIECPYWTQYE